jgi:redox-sensitive bicupin YhaK (pirin superfamily)
MIKIRKSQDRGKFKNSWLDSNHTFSFGEYYDENHMGLSNLRVINDDIVQPGTGFTTHSHRNMEIISYVIDGELEHKDSMGNGGVIKPGDVQRMSAGTGINHSEYNPSKTNKVNFLQIWIEPNQLDIEPEYEQRYFNLNLTKDRISFLHLINGKLRISNQILQAGDAATIYKDMSTDIEAIDKSEFIYFNLPRH